MKVEFVAAAERELDDAVSYFETQCAGLGLAFAAELPRPSRGSRITRTLGKGCPEARVAAPFGRSSTAWSIGRAEMGDGLRRHAPEAKTRLLAQPVAQRMK